MALERRELPKPDHLTPAEFVPAVGAAFPSVRPSFEALTRAYEDVRYGDREITHERLALLKDRRALLLETVRTAPRADTAADRRSARGVGLVDLVVTRSTPADEVLAELRSYANPANVAGMARFGIRGAQVLGGPNLPTLRRIGKRLGRDPALASALWESGVHEARLLATLVADPASFPRAQAEAWVLDLDSWDVCDQLCGNLLDRTPFAGALILAWTSREEEFVKRAGFALIAAMAVHDKAAPDERFLAFLPLIVREAPDRRNFVRKAVNWALREIGKRNPALNAAAVEAAREIKAGPRSGWWVGTDALRELTGENVQRRLRERARSLGA